MKALAQIESSEKNHSLFLTAAGNSVAASATSNPFYLGQKANVIRLVALTAADRPTVRPLALYLRVSTSTQDTAYQRLELERVAQQRGWHIVGLYEDAGISGAKGRDARPEFDRLLNDAARGRFDIVAAWSVDRLGRSLKDLVAFLSDLQATGRDLYLHQQALDTSTPSGRAMFQMLGVFSEFERGMIRERVSAGLARARAKGTKLGRRSVKPAVEERIRELRAAGMGVHRIRREVGVGASVVQRVITIEAP